jgi:hypothetical protein
MAIGKVSFNLDPEALGFGGLEVPVEVCRPDMSVVGRYLHTAREVDLEAGSYFVSARLPSGETTLAHVEVSEGDRSLVDLMPLRDVRRTNPEAFAVEAFGPTHVGRNPVDKLGRGLVSAPPLRLATSVAQEVEPFGDGGVAVAFYAGNLLTERGYWESVHADFGQPYGDGSFVEWGLPPRRDPLYLRMERKGQPDVNVAVPVSATRGCVLRIDSAPGLQPRARFRLAHPQANAVLGYRWTNELDLAEQALRAASFDAGHLFDERGGDAVAGVVLAYALLRKNDQVDVEALTRRLSSAFPSSPDAWAVRAEYLARTGSHGEALKALFRMGKAGVPIFVEGLSMAIDRLRPYSEDAEGDGPSESQALLSRLSAICMACDLHQPTTTFANVLEERTFLPPVPSSARIDLRFIVD